MYQQNKSGIYTVDHQIVIPRGHSVQQQAIMDAFMSHGLLEIWGACGTKFGKSLAASGGFCGRMAIKPETLGRWIAPIYSQSKIGFKYCKRILPGEPIIEVNKSEPSISYTGREAKMEFRSGKNPEDLEGEGTEVNVLDEAAKMSQQVYDSVKTTTTLTRGLVAPFSTPRGKNWFFRKCMEAKDLMLWQMKKGLPVTHIFITAPTSANPMVKQAAIDEARRALPWRLFQQYYLAEFVDDGDVFVGFRRCLFGTELAFDGEMQFWLADDADEASVVVGADWAKTNDRTVFYAIDIKTRRCMGFMRFYKTPYTEAIRRLSVFCKKFHEVIIAKHDKTGLGTVIDDYLAQTELPYEGVTFTNLAKADLVAKLITGVETEDTYLPNWVDLIDEFDAYEVATTAHGSMSYGAAPGKHDDIVTAAMLAYSALLQYGDRDFTVKTLEDIAKPKKTKDATLKADGNTAERDDTSEPALLRFFKDVNGVEDDDDED